MLHKKPVSHRRKKFSIKNFLFSYSKHIVALVILKFFLAMTFLYMRQNQVVSNEWKSFHEIKAVSVSLEENPKFDNENIIKPDYTTYFRGWESGYFDSIKELFHLKQKKLWRAEDFKNLLLRVTKKRTDLGYKSDTVLRMRLQEGMRLIFVGNLQAAFHSLVRDVEEWIKMGILDEQFKMKNKEDYIFFIGNAIDRSPFSIETMSLLMRLIEENPEQIFYLQGNHEDNNYWKDYTLKQELMMKVGGGAKDQIPLEAEVNAFFATLPLAFFAEVYPEGSKKFLRISHEGRDYDKLKEDRLQSFLLSAYEEKISKFQVTNQGTMTGAGGSIALIGLVRSEKKRKTFQTMDGMRMMPPEEGVLAWTILSCPTKVYQLGIKFFYDAFATLICKGPVDQWLITLYNQDVRMKNGFMQRVYNFVSGAVVAGQPEKPSETIDLTKGQPNDGASKKTEETKEVKKDATPEVTIAPSQSVLPVTQPVSPDQKKEATSNVQAVATPPVEAKSAIVPATEKKAEAEKISVIQNDPKSVEEKKVQPDQKQEVVKQPGLIAQEKKVVAPVAVEAPPVKPASDEIVMEKKAPVKNNEEQPKVSEVTATTKPAEEKKKEEKQKVVPINTQQESVKHEEKKVQNALPVNPTEHVLQVTAPPDDTSAGQATSAHAAP
jgi:hypothetical protein